MTKWGRDEVGRYHRGEVTIARGRHGWRIFYRNEEHGAPTRTLREAKSRADDLIGA